MSSTATRFTLSPARLPFRLGPTAASASGRLVAAVLGLLGLLGLLERESAALPALVMDEARRLRRGSGAGGSGSSPLEEEDSSGFILGTPSGSYERRQHETCRNTGSTGRGR